MHSCIAKKFNYLEIDGPNPSQFCSKSSKCQTPSLIWVVDQDQLNPYVAYEGYVVRVPHNPLKYLEFLLFLFVTRRTLGTILYILGALAFNALLFEKK